jgi:colicin import membrane protein
MTEQMELMVVDAQNAVQIFTCGGMNAILDGIEAKVRAISLDPSTHEGREEIRSVAYRVARTKVALDAEGKKLTEGWREATKKVNEERRRAEDRLTQLAEDVRRPLTDFENKEKLRVEAHEAALADITGLHAMVAASPDLSLDVLDIYLRDLRAAQPDRAWEEFSYRAKSAREAAEDYIARRMDQRKRYEVEQEDIARLRREEAERIQRERDEQLKYEAAEKARLEAERKAAVEAEAERQRVATEARRVQEEHDRALREAEAKRKAEEKRLADEAHAIELKRLAEENAKIAALKAAADAEAARIASEKKAEADRIAAQKKAEADKQAAIAKERERVEAERKKAEADRLKREADQKLRLKIRGEIADDLRGGSSMEMDEDVSLWIADALLDGKIRHVKVVF